MISNILGYELLKGREKVSTSALTADYIGLYFSAHWCPPCRAFTPRLSQRYHQIKGLRKSFEVIFVSMDRDEGSFNDYYASMPWLAIPFNAQVIKQSLSSRYGISGIPALIIIDKNGYLQEKEGRGRIMDDNFVSTIPTYVDPAIAKETVEDTLNHFVADDRIELSFKKNGLLTLCKIFSNVTQNAGDPKYLTLKKSNQSVQAKLGHPDLIKLLKHAGFSEDPNVYQLNENYVDYRKLKEMTNLLSEVMSSMDTGEVEAS